MASSSSNPTTIPSSFAIPVTEKLSKTNYLLWRAQVMPAIKAAHLEDLLLSIEKMSTKTTTTKDGESVVEKNNPEYLNSVTRDQALLGYLFSSLTCDVLQGVTMLTMLVAVWSALQEMYASHTRAGSINTHIALAMTCKGASTMADCFNKMKRHANEMAATCQSLGDKEFVAYVLTGLDEEIYNSFVSSILTRVEPITPSELYSQMLSFELRLEKPTGGAGGYSSMNVTTHGRGRPCTHGGPSQSGRGHGRSHNSGRGAPTGNRGSYNNTNAQRASGSPSDGGQSHPHCQVCFKIGHTAANCWYRYDEVYVPDSRMAGMAYASTTDSNWYLDLGATDHITIELEKLTMHETYHGNDKIRAANDAGMDITHVGKAILSAPSRTLCLNNVLHVPNSHKQLDSVGTLNTGYPRVQAPCQDERQDGRTCPGAPWYRLPSPDTGQLRSYHVPHGSSSCH
jgi:hypothetical protein